MKVVLVTGGSRGIGADTVKLFARNGYTVILNYHKSEQAASELCQSLVAEGRDVHMFRADISDSAQISEMFLWVQKYFKHIDVLVNNAGIALTKLCQDIAETEFDSVMDVNAKGAFLCCQQAVKMFLSAGRGAIVNVSSIWGVMGASCEVAYSMSKHALVGLTKSLAEELSQSNITVNCVCPPIVLTDMSRSLSEQDIAEFCAERDVAVYTPQQVAQDIFRLAVGEETGVILQER